MRSNWPLVSLDWYKWQYCTLGSWDLSYSCTNLTSQFVINIVCDNMKWKAPEHCFVIGAMFTSLYTKIPECDQHSRRPRTLFTQPRYAKSLLPMIHRQKCGGVAVSNRPTPSSVRILADLSACRTLSVCTRILTSLRTITHLCIVVALITSLIRLKCSHN